MWWQVTRKPEFYSWYEERVPLIQKFGNSVRTWMPSHLLHAGFLYSDFFFAMKMDVIRCSDVSVHVGTTWRSIPKDETVQRIKYSHPTKIRCISFGAHVQHVSPWAQRHNAVGFQVSLSKHDDATQGLWERLCSRSAGIVYFTRKSFIFVLF
jgi:hypothetical protein